MLDEKEDWTGFDPPFIIQPAASMVASKAVICTQNAILERDNDQLSCPRVRLCPSPMQECGTTLGDIDACLQAGPNITSAGATQAANSRCERQGLQLEANMIDYILFGALETFSYCCGSWDCPGRECPRNIE